eukprot:5003005-Pleurochrysis_carterae.AAC.4
MADAPVSEWSARTSGMSHTGAWRFRDPRDVLGLTPRQRRALLEVKQQFDGRSRWLERVRVRVGTARRAGLKCDHGRGWGEGPPSAESGLEKKRETEKVEHGGDAKTVA